MSMKPGATTSPVASNTSAFSSDANFPDAPISLMASPSSNTSIAASVLEAGSSTRPFLIRSILRILLRRNFVCGAAIVLNWMLERRVGTVFGGASHEQVQNRHAHGHTVRNLFQHARLRPVSNIRGYFDAAIYRSRMKHD